MTSLSTLVTKKAYSSFDHQYTRREATGITANSVRGRGWEYEKRKRHSFEQLRLHNPNLAHISFRVFSVFFMRNELLSPVLMYEILFGKTTPSFCTVMSTAAILPTIFYF